MNGLTQHTEMTTEVNPTMRLAFEVLAVLATFIVLALFFGFAANQLPGIAS